MYGTCTAGGSSFTTRRVRGLRDAHAGGSREASSCASRFAKIAPKTETPIEPPIWRKSVEPDVATPMWRKSTEFCAASTSTCIVIPSPSPRISMNSAACHVGVSTTSSERSNMPDRHDRRAAIGNGR